MLSSPEPRAPSPEPRAPSPEPDARIGIRHKKSSLLKRDGTIKNGPTLGRMGPFRKLPVDEPEGSDPAVSLSADQVAIAISHLPGSWLSVQLDQHLAGAVPLGCLAGRQSSLISILPALCPSAAWLAVSPA
ncbi:hypothetical protein M2367_003599 [Aeromonas sp. BIGb0445]|nr:hypothetical protein [Aeromonas sp. BIGb0445]